jgi:Phosphate-induced protein 1 conserved region
MSSKLYVTLAVFLAASQTLPAQPAGSNLVYRGGEVMTGPLSVYFLWYGRSSSSHMSAITTFARNISGSPWFSMVGTFTDNRGRRISNSFPLVAAAFDDQYSFGHDLGQADEQAFIKRSIDSGRLPFDPNGVYVILTAPDVTVPNNGSTCAYHRSLGFRGATLKYGVIINPANSRTPAGCNLFRSGPAPNGNAATDWMIHYLGHELVEAVTNPTFDGWSVNSPQGFAEVVDVCESTRDFDQKLPNGAIYTVADSGRYYHLPAVFKNTGRANCSIR